MRLYYIFDTYCGWCYGFDAILKPFVKAHLELEVNVLSGGLFLEGQPLSAFPHMKKANERIASIFEVTFGKSLSDVETLKSIATTFGLATDGIEKKFTENRNGKPHPDFDEADKLGATSYPTLLAEIDGKFYDVKGNAFSLKALERNLKAIKEKGGISDDQTEAQSCKIDGSGC